MARKQKSPSVTVPRMAAEQAERGTFTMKQLMGTNVVGWILSVIVLLLLFLNGAILRKPVVLLLAGDRATGMVVGWKQDGNVKAPVVEFVARAGARVRVTGRVSTTSPSGWRRS